jgi:hypothetical protein
VHLTEESPASLQNGGRVAGYHGGASTAHVLATSGVEQVRTLPGTGACFAVTLPALPGSRYAKELSDFKVRRG